MDACCGLSMSPPAMSLEKSMLELLMGSAAGFLSLSVSGRGIGPWPGTEVSLGF